MPSIGTPLDQTGTPRSLESMAGKKGTVFFFYRSASWCPYCQAQLIDLNSGVADLQKRGYSLVGISYDDPKILADFTAARAIQYTLLSDPKSEVIDRATICAIRNTRKAAAPMAYRGLSISSWIAMGSSKANSMKIPT